MLKETADSGLSLGPPSSITAAVGFMNSEGGVNSKPENPSGSILTIMHFGTRGNSV